MEENTRKYTIWISTDNKNTLTISADNSTEALNALESENVSKIWQDLRNKAAENKLGQQTVQTVANGSAGDCPIHKVPMEWGTSKKTGKPYKFHKIGDLMCFGHPA